ncbi:SLAIN motif-containing protein-like isoform 1-T3 [Anomaloglossus baeobatrachus]|uniref:SLAIN motif-containing protein-like isoform X1 n=1 Tax=Anomaloglossus baeobatrachus TaxID=238106 RepID=UPI003F4FB360
MVVPDSSPGIQHERMRSDGMMDGESKADASSDLKEVRKLHELVRRLEIQNQQLRVKKNLQGTSHEPGVDPHLSALHASGVMNSMNIHPEMGDLQIIPDLHSKLEQIHSEKENIPRLRVDAQVQYDKVCPDAKPSSKDGNHCDPDDSAFFSLDLSGRTEDGVGKMSEGSSSADLVGLLDETALDEVEVLELGSCSEDDEDCWLYVSPNKLASAEQKPDSPLKWCRQVLDHHSPETEAACRTLIGKLDQASRWKSLYCSPLASPSAYNANHESSCCSNTLNSPGCLKSTNKALLTCGSSGYMSVHSALSSQSSVDSELSTSDDSISMGYKLQDLTDVQVMARLQEESLRQDYASSSASVSRRSSSASLNSLRRGTFSDQEFDTYSLEDDDDCDCSLSYRSAHRYSPSPLSSPRCQSPSATGESSRAAASRIRPPRRSMQNQGQERMKYPGYEDDLRHSMPNLAKTSLRSLEAVRSSRSLESDLQGPSGRLTRIQPSTSSVPQNKMRYSSGSSHPAGVRQPMKTGLSTSSLMNSRQPMKSSGYNGSGGIRKMSSPGLAPVIPGASRTSNLPPSMKHSGAKSQTSSGNAAPKSKMVQPSRRSLSSRTNPLDNDDSWKEGCY